MHMGDGQREKGRRREAALPPTAEQRALSHEPKIMT